MVVWITHLSNKEDEEETSGSFDAKRIQGYFAHQKTATPLGSAEDPRHRPKVGS